MDLYNRTAKNDTINQFFLHKCYFLTQKQDNIIFIIYLLLICFAAQSQRSEAFTELLLNQHPGRNNKLVCHLKNQTKRYFHKIITIYFYVYVQILN